MRNTILLTGVLMVGLGSASAQLISIGLKGGVPLTDPEYASRQESRPYIVGASIEFRLPARFAVEADVLYQRIGTSSQFGYFGSILAGENLLYPSLISYRQRGNSWEFPVIGKYYFRKRDSAWQPFLGTGYAFRTIQFTTDTSVVTNNSDNGTTTLVGSHFSYRSGLGVGAVGAAGVKLRAGRFAIVPEFRYTRWGGLQTGVIRKNQVAFLVGITF